MKFTVGILLIAINFTGCGNPGGSGSRTPSQGQAGQGQAGDETLLNAVHHEHYHVHGREITHQHVHPGGAAVGHRHPHDHVLKSHS